MTDYRLETKVRNGRVLRALDGLGETPHSFAKSRGLNYVRLASIISMKSRPFDSKGIWWPEIMALCDETGTMPSDLFTARQIEGVRTNSQKIDVEEKQLEIAMHEIERLRIGTEDPLDHMVAIEKAEIISECMNKLAPRHRRVLEMHLDGATLQEIGDELNVSKERVRQIYYLAKNRVKSWAQKRGVTP